MPYKKERMEKILKREISDIILTQCKDARMKYVTVTKVDVTADLLLGIVYFTVYGDEGEIKAGMKVLEDAKGFIRTALSRRLSVRKVPELRFKYDESYEKGQRIEEILRNLK